MLLRRGYSHAAAATKIAHLHKVQPVTKHMPASPLLQQLLADHNLVPMKFDFAEENAKHPELGAFLGGSFGHDDKRMMSAYFLDREYVAKAADSLRYRTEPVEVPLSHMRIVGETLFSAAASGPAPDAVHGGALATMLDNFCGFTINGLYNTGYRTANLNINYRDRVPTAEAVAFRCRIERVDGRKAFMSTAFLDAASAMKNGFWGEKGEAPKVLAEATALMIHAAKKFDKNRMTA